MNKVCRVSLVREQSTNDKKTDYNNWLENSHSLDIRTRSHAENARKQTETTEENREENKRLIKPSRNYDLTCIHNLRGVDMKAYTQSMFSCS